MAFPVSYTFEDATGAPVAAGIPVSIAPLNATSTTTTAIVGRAGVASFSVPNAGAYRAKLSGAGVPPLPYDFLVRAAGDVVPATLPFLQDRDFGVIGDNVADDAPALQLLLTAAAASGYEARLGPGRFRMKSAVTMDSKVVLRGAGSKTSVLVWDPAFVPPAPATTYGGNGAYGLINLNDFLGTTAPITGARIYDLGCDLTASTLPVGPGVVQCGIHQFGRNVIDLQIERVDFQLTGGNTEGIVLESLGANNASSHDITIRDLTATNGLATCLLFLNGSGSGSAYHDVLIDNVHSYISSSVNDDRVGIMGNTPGGSATNLGEVRDVTVRNQFVHVVDALTPNTLSGVSPLANVNGVKIDTGVYTYVHDILVDGLMYRGSPAGVSANGGNYPVISLLNTGSFIENISVRNVRASYSSRLKLQLNRHNPDPHILIDNVRLDFCLDSVAGVEVYVASAPSGDEGITLRNVSARSIATKSGMLPVGCMLTGGGGQGTSGRTTIEDCIFDNFSRSYSDNLTEAGATQATAFSGVTIQRSRMQTPLQYGSAPRVRDCPGINPSGQQGVGTITSGVALYNFTPFDLTYYVTGGTVSSIQIQNATTGATSGAFRVPYGSNLTLTFSAMPTVTAFAD
ncbi:MAG: hypothetical protein NVSMB19_25510 [Vulcanimicrobiaceae bacterium]